MSYAAFAAELRATGVLSDPWLDGVPRFEEEPVVLAADEAEALAAAAESVVAALNQLARIVAAGPVWLDWLGLSPHQRIMWHASAPHWHGLARADAFFVGHEVQVCEVNCDTPSGEAEAVILNRIAAANRPTLGDPNRGLLPRLGALVDAVAPRRGTVGLLYPTEMTEDLSMIALYRELFAGRGWRVALGSPFNLTRAPGGRLALLGEPVDVLVRHYKTDWWGEREPVWTSAAPPNDAEPLAGQLGLLTGAILDGTCAVVNPLGAVVPQNKRALALLWHLVDRLPDEAAAAVRRHVPFTARLEDLPAAQLIAEREDWVLKSDYGCEGDEVLLGADLDEADWRSALEDAVPGRWIAQRRFRPRAGRAAVVNHGVYVVAGQAAGLMTRISDGKTDAGARTVATLVAR